MLLAFYYFKMMFTDYLLILVLIFDFTFFCSKFYVLINRFYFAINFFSIGKNVYYLRVQFVCIYLQRVLSHNGQYLQNKYLCSFSHSHITKNILRDLCISVLALFSQIAYIVYLLPSGVMVTLMPLLFYRIKHLKRHSPVSMNSQPGCCSFAGRFYRLTKEQHAGFFNC